MKTRVSLKYFVNDCSRASHKDLQSVQTSTALPMLRLLSPISCKAVDKAPNSSSNKQTSLLDGAHGCWVVSRTLGNYNCKSAIFEPNVAEPSVYMM